MNKPLTIAAAVLLLAAPAHAQSFMDDFVNGYQQVGRDRAAIRGARAFCTTRDRGASRREAIGDMADAIPTRIGSPLFEQGMYHARRMCPRLAEGGYPRPYDPDEDRPYPSVPTYAPYPPPYRY